MGLKLLVSKAVQFPLQFYEFIKQKNSPKEKYFETLLNLKAEASRFLNIDSYAPSSS